MVKDQEGSEKYFNENKIAGCITASIISLSASVILFILGINKGADLDAVLAGNKLVQASTLTAIISIVFVGFAILLKTNPYWFKREK